MKKLVIVTGPTAVGKTDLSIRLAKKINGEIISADSIQVYKYMDIGSAKITKREMCGIKHYLIDEFMPDQEFHVQQFQTMAKKYMEEIYEKGKIPIIVGGTGFYIQSVLYDIQFNEKKCTYERPYDLNKLAQENPIELYKRLCEIDEESAKIIHKNNVRRVLRALEYYYDTGEKISKHNKEQRKKQSPYLFSYFVLTMNRNKLYEKINNRVKQMIARGLVTETQKLLSMGYEKYLVSMQGIGYKESVAYLDGKISYDEMIDLIQKNTRHFAKRQLTWFRREREVTMVPYEEFCFDKDKILNFMLNHLREKGITGYE